MNDIDQPPPISHIFQHFPVFSRNPLKELTDNGISQSVTRGPSSTLARPASRSLSREESKLITRKRLIEAAADLVREEGPGALTTGRVARAAGVAQPTFYVHFKDMAELLETLARDKMGQMRQPLREARQAIRDASSDDPVRETFRLPLAALLEHPELFRLSLQEHYQPASPIGRVSRELRAELQSDLVEDLISIGAPAATAPERQKLEMTAEGCIVLTQTLAVGYMEGRYTDLEQVVDVLVGFALGAIGMQVPSRGLSA